MRKRKKSSRKRGNARSIYGSKIITKFINSLTCMTEKKAVATNIMYSALN